MKQVLLFKRVMFVILLILLSATLSSQVRSDFSGKWALDNSKSSEGTNKTNYPGAVVMEIAQNDATITMHDIYSLEGKVAYTSADKVYKIEGHDEADKSDPDVTISIALKWADDRKSFTVFNKSSFMLQGVRNDIILNETYNLSEDKKVLTVSEYRKTDLGEFNFKFVYNRK